MIILENSVRQEGRKIRLNSEYKEDTWMRRSVNGKLPRRNFKGKGFLPNRLSRILAKTGLGRQKTEGPMSRPHRKGLRGAGVKFGQGEILCQYGLRFPFL